MSILLMLKTHQAAKKKHAFLQNLADKATNIDADSMERVRALLKVHKDTIEKIEKLQNREVVIRKEDPEDHFENSFGKLDNQCENLELDVGNIERKIEDLLKYEDPKFRINKTPSTELNQRITAFVRKASAAKDQYHARIQPEEFDSMIEKLPPEELKLLPNKKGRALLLKKINGAIRDLDWNMWNSQFLDENLNELPEIDESDPTLASILEQNQDYCINNQTTLEMDEDEDNDDARTLDSHNYGDEDEVDDIDIEEEETSTDDDQNSIIFLEECEKPSTSNANVSAEERDGKTKPDIDMLEEQRNRCRKDLKSFIYNTDGSNANQSEPTSKVFVDKEEDQKSSDEILEHCTKRQSDDDEIQIIGVIQSKKARND